MMHRFENEHNTSYLKNIFISLAIFFLIFICFWFGISSFSGQTEAEEMRTLENAIMRNITQYYAVEGFYPEDLDDLKESYGLYYDEDKFFVDYQPLGANILPDVTIIKKGEQN